MLGFIIQKEHIKSDLICLRELRWIKCLELFYNFLIPGNTIVIWSGNCAKRWSGPCDLLFFRIGNGIVEIQHISGDFFTKQTIRVSLKGAVSRASAGIEMTEN